MYSDLRKYITSKKNDLYGDEALRFIKLLYLYCPDREAVNEFHQECVENAEELQWDHDFLFNLSSKDYRIEEMYKGGDAQNPLLTMMMKTILPMGGWNYFTECGTASDTIPYYLMDKGSDDYWCRIRRPMRKYLFENVLEDVEDVGKLMKDINQGNESAVIDIMAENGLDECFMSVIVTHFDPDVDPMFKDDFARVMKVLDCGGGYYFDVSIDYDTNYPMDPPIVNYIRLVENYRDPNMAAYNINGLYESLQLFESSTIAGDLIAAVEVIHHSRKEIIF